MSSTLRACLPLLAALLIGCATATENATVVVSPCAVASASTADRADAPLHADLCSIVAGFRAHRANLHSLIVMRDGRTLVEVYRDGADRGLYSLWATHRTFGPDDLHDMRSVTKSVIAMAYGVLAQRGEVPGLDVRLASLYPAQAALFEGGRGSIRIRDLLTMRAGLDWNEPSPVRRTHQDDQPGLMLRDRLSLVFGRDMIAAPGVQFTYSGGLTSVLADVMERATGRPVSELVDATLFQPLGITDWAWERDLRGRPVAFAGLRLRPRDLARLGELVRRRGTWAGAQLVPADWIDTMTTPHIVADARYGYGLQWWVRTYPVGGAPVRVAEAIGNGGQRVFVAPTLNLVVALTGGDYGSPEILAVEDRLFVTVAQAVAAADQRAGAASPAGPTR